MERENDIDKTIEVLQRAIDKVHESVRLEAMWDPSLADPEIPLDEEELDDFIKSFSDDEKGAELREWVKLGVPCEATRTEGEELLPCNKNAVASVDWSGVIIADSVLVCRQDLRYLYKDIMENAVRKEGIYPFLTINGKEVPKFKPQE